MYGLSFKVVVRSRCEFLYGVSYRTAVLTAIISAFFLSISALRTADKTAIGTAFATTKRTAFETADKTAINATEWAAINATE